MMNEGESVVSSLSIAVEAGVLLGAGYMLTRRLWFVWGLHFAWNVVQGGVFGAAVSGTTVPGLLRSEATGEDWLTGGKFGPEESVLTFVLCTAAGVALFVPSRADRPCDAAVLGAAEGSAAGCRRVTPFL